MKYYFRSQNNVNEEKTQVGVSKKDLKEKRKASRAKTEANGLYSQSKENKASRPSREHTQDILRNQEIKVFSIMFTWTCSCILIF